MSEFTQQMAEMIAQARPKAPGGGGGRAMSGGGVTSGSEKSAQANVFFDPDAFVKMKNLIMGRDDPSVTASKADKAWETWANVSAVDEKEAQKLTMNPQVQMLMNEAARNKHPGIIDTGERTSLGQPVWGWAPRPSNPEAWKANVVQGRAPNASSEQKMNAFFAHRAPNEVDVTSGGLEGIVPDARKNVLDFQKGIIEKTTAGTETGILSGMGTMEQRKNLLSAKEEIANAAKQTNEIDILSGRLGADLATSYIENKRNLEKPQLHPAIEGLYKAQEENTLVEASVRREMMKIDPEKARALIALSNAQAGHEAALRDKARKEIELYSGTGLNRLTPEGRAIVKEADTAFHGAANALEKAYTGPGGYGLIKDLKKSYDKLSLLGDYTQRHATAVDPLFNPQGTLPRDRVAHPTMVANIDYFTKQVQNYLSSTYASEAKKGVGWGGVSKEKRAEYDNYAFGLMNQVVELHRKFTGTDESKALAKLYMGRSPVEVLNLLEELRSGAGKKK